MEDFFMPMFEEDSHFYEYQNCRRILDFMMFDSSKAISREILLKQHPELQIKVDTQSLKQIVPYKSFKCHPNCSVARGQAVREDKSLHVEASDIDGGLVVLEEPVSLEKQMEFINELRSQGFRVFHKNEAEMYEAAYKAIINDEANINSYTTSENAITNAINLYVESRSRTVSFFTQEELAQISDHNTIYCINIAGYEIT